MLDKIRSIFKNDALEKEIDSLKQNEAILKRRLFEKDFVYDKLLKNKNEILTQKEELDSLLLKEKSTIEKLKDEYIKQIVMKVNLIKNITGEKNNLEDKLNLEIKEKELLEKKILNLEKIRNETQIYLKNQNKRMILNILNQVIFLKEFDKKLNNLKIEYELKLELLKKELSLKELEIKNLKITHNFELKDKIKKVNLENENKNILTKELDETKRQNLELLKSSVNLNYIEEKESLEVETTQNLFLGKWADKKQFIKNQKKLIDLLKSFNLDDFNEMYLEGQKRGILKYNYEKGLSNIISRLKLDLILTQSILERVIPFYIELINSLEEDVRVEYLNQNLILELGEWSTRKIYISSKKDPINTVLKFNLKDFDNMYSFSKKENILLESEMRYLLYVIEWLKKKKPLIYLDLEKISKIYTKIIECSIKNKQSFQNKVLNRELKESNKKEFNTSIDYFKIQDFKEFYLETKKINFLNSVEERHLLNIISLLEIGRKPSNLSLEKISKSYQNFINLLNKSQKQSLNSKFNIENYSSKECFFIYEKLKGNRAIPKWYRLFILALGRQKEEGLEITEYQYKISKAYSLELSKIIKEIKNKDIVEFILTDSFEEEVISENFKPKEEKKIEKPVVRSSEKKSSDTKFQIEDYTEDELYRIYEIAKEFQVKNWIQNSLYTLWKYKSTNSKIFSNQYTAIRKNYSELYEVIKKFESEKIVYFEKKEEDKDILKLEPKIIDILF